MQISDLENVTTNNKLKIKNKEFAYKIQFISDTVNTSYYYEVIIESEFSDNVNVNNNVINFKILLSKKTILEYIFYKLGGN